MVICESLPTCNLFASTRRNEMVRRDGLKFEKKRLRVPFQEVQEIENFRRKKPRRLVAFRCATFYPKCLTLQNPSRVRNACADMRAFSLRLRSVCLCKRNLFQKEYFLTAAEEETGGGTGLVVWRKCKTEGKKIASPLRADVV